MSDQTSTPTSQECGSSKRPRPPCGSSGAPLRFRAVAENGARGTGPENPLLSQNRKASFHA